MNTPDGRKKVPLIKVVVNKLAQKALEGHGPSLRFLLTMHAKALKEHGEAHRKEFKDVEELEQMYSLTDDSGFKSLQKKTFAS